MGPPGKADFGAVPAAGPPDRERYREYRRRQCLRLLSLLPPGAVRPLYRRARTWSGRRGRVADPMGVLLDYCQTILPLPTFEAWMEDRTAHPAAHLDEVPGPGGEPDGAEPVTVEVRPLRVDGASWNAELGVRPDGAVWRGHITFRAEGAPRGHPTGEIFREPAAEAVRARFLEFDERTLRAFLRSALP